MSDTARDYQTMPPTATEGLEDFFEPNETQLEPNENHLEPLDSHLILTVAEASTHLKMPISTIYRRIKTGKFKTQHEQDGTVRIILPIENQVITTFSINENQNQHVILSDSHFSKNENHGSHLPVSSELERVLELLAERDRKLEAATYRVGYLESKLEERDSQIKLLTDSQQKPKRWAQFVKWFLGH